MQSKHGSEVNALKDFNMRALMVLKYETNLLRKMVVESFNASVLIVMDEVQLSIFSYGSPDTKSA